MKTDTPPAAIARISLVLCILALLLPAGTQAEMAVLEVDGRNPRWLRAGGQGKAVVLTGSHTWSVFQDYQAENFRFTTDYFNPVIVGKGHNYIRGWIWEDDYYSPLVYSKSGSLFNLDVVNHNLFGPNGPIQERLRLTPSKDVYVSVMLFQGWSTGRFANLRVPNPWETSGTPPIPHHPYHKDFNSNGVDGNFLGGPDGREIQEKIAQGQPGRAESQKILGKQIAYVNQVVDRLKGFNNIIWEVSNETHLSSASVAWQNEIAAAIRARDNNNHLVKISCLNETPLQTMLAMDAKLIAPCIAAADGLDIKSADPPHATGRKVLIADSDHIGVLDFIDTKNDCNENNDVIRSGTDMWAWKYFLRGYHPTFMDLGYDLEWFSCPKWGPQRFLSTWNRIRQTLGAIQKVAGKVRLHQLVPQRKGTFAPVSWQSGSGNIFALYGSGRADEEDIPNQSKLPVKGREYLVWVPKSDVVKVCKLKANRKYKVRWRDLLTGDGAKQIREPGPDCQFFHNNTGADAILHLKWGPKVAPPGVEDDGAYGSFSFDSAGSSNEDGETFHWDFGDGSSASGPTASHTFAPGAPFI